MNKTVQQSFRLIMGRMVEGSNPGAGKIFLSREISVVQRGSSLHVFCYIKKSRDGPSLLSSSFPKKILQCLSSAKPSTFLVLQGFKVGASRHEDVTDLADLDVARRAGKRLKKKRSDISVGFT